MINRYFKDGQKLDVAGLNEITVLLDRSETEITEIGWNCWTPKQDGPPHKHNDKDQIFYVTGGVGIIKLGDKEYPAKKGCLAYVPAGLVHQTITTTEEKLCYMLFNIFRTENKEGHGSFAEHIEKVKHIRRQQADTGVTDIEAEEVITDIKPHKYFEAVNEDAIYVNGSLSSIRLLHSAETNKGELSMITLPENYKESVLPQSDKEQVFFILEGEGVISMNDEQEEIKPHHLIYIPRNQKYSIEATKGSLSYLCLNGLINGIKSL